MFLRHHNQINTDSPATSSSDQSMGPLLQGHQKTLYEALVQKNHKLAEMYLGALYVLAQSESPDRLALAAHGFRELMEKLPREEDVPILSKPPTLMEKVRSLAGAWKHTSKHSRCRQSEGWKGAIDRHLKEFLQKTGEFFDWFEKDRPSRNEQKARALRRWDPMGIGLPPIIEKLRIKEWEQCHDYFEGVAHHSSKTASLEEMAKWIRATENFLLDRLQPRTFEDHSKLDKIIKDDTPNA